MAKIYDTVIIGGGPAGFTAAMYAARAGLDTLVLEKMSIGGQMALTSQIDNYPGFPQGIDGFELGMQMRQGAEKAGAEIRFAEVLSLELKGSPKNVETDSGTLQARTVILATGASPRLLGLSREQELTGRGISYCAHCDGMFYRGKTVAVVGGGNSAVAEALHLARICKNVILIHRRDTLRATKTYHEQLEKTENLQILWNSRVIALHGQDRLTGITVDNPVSGERRELELDGLFVSVGRQPATELVAGQLTLDEGGYVMAGEDTLTNIPGVFAAGDVRTKHLRQIVTAVADGAQAAAAAEEYLKG